MSTPASLQSPPADLPPLEQLRRIMAQLRGPGGCPWDQEQNHRTLRNGLLEEAYEVVAAIDAADDANLREELGDLLLQVVFHSQLGAEGGRFTLDDVARGIVEKLVRRHPHVFAQEHAASSGAVVQRWEEIKRAEKAAAGQVAAPSALGDLPTGAPALMLAEKAQKRAAKVGFDWPAVAPVIAKIREELAELEAALAAGDARETERELGDVLFSVVNLARHVQVEPEVALRGAVEKFIRRFHQVEALAVAEGAALGTVTLEEMDKWWDQAKAEERG